MNGRSAERGMYPSRWQYYANLHKAPLLLDLFFHLYLKGDNNGDLRRKFDCGLYRKSFQIHMLCGSVLSLLGRQSKKIRKINQP